MPSKYSAWTNDQLKAEIKKLKAAKKTEGNMFSDSVINDKLRHIVSILNKRLYG